MRRDGPLVSVVIPTHDRARLVGRAVRSVLAQTVDDLEVIVVDDASSDGTAEVIAAMGDARVRYLRRETRGGGSAARNVGLDAAAGEFVGFLDSDDEWMPAKLERQLAVFRAHDGADPGVVSCWGTAVYAGGEALGHRAVLRGDEFERLLALKVNCTTGALLLRRRVIDEGYRFDEALPAYQDRDFLMRVARAHLFETVEEPLLRMHHDHGGPRVFNPVNARRAVALLMEKYRAELQARPPVLARYHKRLAWLCMLVGDTAGMRRAFLAALRARPSDHRSALWLLASLFGTGAVSRLARASRELKRAAERSA